MEEEQPQKPEPTPPQQNRFKEGKTATLICTIITILALLTLILGFLWKNPYLIIAGIFPAAIYEAWRTEGFFTKIASVGIVILVILEILAILGIFQINLAQIFQQEGAYLQGYYLPLGDVRFVFPAIVVILALVLLFRTYGKYTKWLSVVILINSVGLLYLVNKQVLVEIIRNFLYFI